MKARTAFRLAWGVSALTMVLVVCAVALAVLNRPNVAAAAIFPLALTVSAVVGGLVASRRPTNPVGWFFLGSAGCFVLSEVAAGYTAYGLPGAQAAAWLVSWLWVPGVTLMLCFLPLYFPDGRLVSPRWRWVARLALVFSVGGMVVAAVNPGEIQQEGIVNPLGIEALEPVFGLLDVFVFLVYFVILFASAASLVVRFRHSGSVERQQIKWLALAALAIPVWFLTNAPIQAAAPTLFIVMDAFVVSTLIPLAAGMAVLRYRLYDIDVVINRALVYGALSASLALVYFGSVVGLQYVFRSLGGGESSLAVVASTLLIAALFNPLRRRVQGFIDRRFYRKKYDAQKTLQSFSTVLRDETDLVRLAPELLVVVRETMQPAHVSLWLRPTHEAGGLRQGSRTDE